MKNKKILFIIGISLLLLTSCKKNTSSESENNLSRAISEIKNLGDFQKIKYEFIGNPNYDTKENSNSVIKLELIEGKIANIDNKKFGEKCAKIISNASEKTKKYNKIWVSFIDTNKNNNEIVIGIIFSKEVRNFFYEKSDL